VEKFGSFGTPEVCLFCSDVDVAVFDEGMASPQKVTQPPPRGKEGDENKVKDAAFRAKVDRWKHLMIEKDDNEWEISDSDEDDEGNGLDDSKSLSGDDGDKFGFNISVESANSSSGKSSPNLSQAPSISRKKRNLCNDLLNSLSKPLRKAPYVSNLFIRRKARIPIINFYTAFGIEVDIAVGGVASVDTTAYASECIKAHGSLFSDVCLCLKLLLVQRGYDKPFTGGIGSYKLYVMLSAHLEVVKEEGVSEAEGKWQGGERVTSL